LGRIFAFIPDPREERGRNWQLMSISLADLTQHRLDIIHQIFGVKTFHLSA